MMRVGVIGGYCQLLERLQMEIRISNQRCGKINGKARRGRGGKK
jgi:hypothetical protein